MSGLPWPPSTFLIATHFGPQTRAGYVYKGLGLHQASACSPKGRRKPVWILSHLGSGHRVAAITGTVATAFPIATEIADAGDWTFDGLTGWQNQFPDVSARFQEIWNRHGKAISRGSSGTGSEDIAREIAMARTA